MLRVPSKRQNINSEQFSQLEQLEQSNSQLLDTIVVEHHKPFVMEKLVQFDENTEKLIRNVIEKEHKKKQNMVSEFVKVYKILSGSINKHFEYFKQNTKTECQIQIHCEHNESAERCSPTLENTLPHYPGTALAISIFRKELEELGYETKLSFSSSYDADYREYFCKKFVVTVV